MESTSRKIQDLTDRLAKHNRPADPIVAVLERQEIAERIDRLLTRLEYARGMEVETDLAAYLVGELAAAKITSPQWNTAENWILFGDWTFRTKSPRLLLSDFFPTKKQIQETAEALTGDLVLVHLARIRALTRDYYRAGAKDALSNKNAAEATPGPKNDHLELIRELQTELLNEKAQKSDLRQQLDALERRIDTLEDERDRWKLRAVEAERKAEE